MLHHYEWRWASRGRAEQPFQIFTFLCLLKLIRHVRFMAVVRSLTGIVYEDDNQIAEPHLKRADDKVWPTIEISVFHLI
jgi:hypothetical protein